MAFQNMNLKEHYIPSPRFSSRNEVSISGDRGKSVNRRGELFLILEETPKSRPIRSRLGRRGAVYG